MHSKRHCEPAVRFRCQGNSDTHSTVFGSPLLSRHIGQDPLKATNNKRERERKSELSCLLFVVSLATNVKPDRIPVALRHYCLEGHSEIRRAAVVTSSWISPPS
ncbi:hypothetical protein Q8A67_011903 [Cirrhinus molitorella]|uniref:Uncharacterized protein n=1 Tax=Cirrhinus molitorella TaxID=172907 RepID=A0AA88PVD3_9TELE|nr:hypothetical protein Q8A67_011903 [Cirrhinus molitorella]